MDKTDGWVAIYRSLQNHWLWQDKPFATGQAWVDLILLANHRTRKIQTRTDLLEVKRGQLYRAERTLGARWGWSQKKVRNFLSRLEQDGMILREVKKSITGKSSEGSIMTVVNYGLHQDLRINERISERSNGESVGNQPGISGESKQQENNGTTGQWGGDSVTPEEGDKRNDDRRNCQTPDVFSGFIP